MPITLGEQVDCSKACLVKYVSECDPYCTSGCASRGAGLCDSQCAGGYSLVDSGISGETNYTCSRTSPPSFILSQCSTVVKAMNVKYRKWRLEGVM